MKKVLLLAMLLFVTLSWNISQAPQALAQEKIKLSYADYAAPGYDQLNYIKHYIQRISEETNGKVEITL
jgi:TRAP-type C4-dicarboxylate transport system substrate-binding protein